MNKKTTTIVTKGVTCLPTGHIITLLIAYFPNPCFFSAFPDPYCRMFGKSCTFIQFCVCYICCFVLTGYYSFIVSLDYILYSLMLLWRFLKCISCHTESILCVCFQDLFLLHVTAVWWIGAWFCSCFEGFSDICNAFLHILFWYRWYRICVLHMCYLWIFAYVYLLFVKSVNRAYFKYVCDQVRGYPLTEGDKELDEVQEG
jgi:hypothetical protein